MLIRRDALTPHNRLINSMFLKFTPVKWRARIRDILDSIDRDSILAQARADIAGRLRSA
jgi:hypothetical protein